MNAYRFDDRVSWIVRRDAFLCPAAVSRKKDQVCSLETAVCRHNIYYGCSILKIMIFSSI